MEKISCLASGGVPLHVFVRAVTETCTKASTEGLQGELTNLAIDAVIQMGTEEIEWGEVGVASRSNLSLSSLFSFSLASWNPCPPSAGSLPP